MSDQSVFRLIVDYWPTPNGEPFADQTLEFWEQVVEDYANGVGPAWLPGDLSPYGPDAFDSAKYTHWVGDPGDPGVGDPDATVIFVPIAPTRRFLSRGPVAAMARQLRDWGCRAHIERAQVGVWEVIDA